MATRGLALSDLKFVAGPFGRLVRRHSSFRRTPSKPLGTSSESLNLLPAAAAFASPRWADLQNDNTLVDNTELAAPQAEPRAEPEAQAAGLAETSLQPSASLPSATSPSATSPSVPASPAASSPESAAAAHSRHTQGTTQRPAAPAGPAASAAAASHSSTRSPMRRGRRRPEPFSPLQDKAPRKGVLRHTAGALTYRLGELYLAAGRPQLID